MLNDAKFIREIQDHYNTQIEEMPQDLEDINTAGKNWDLIHKNNTYNLEVLYNW